ncbi:uncharacterized protein L201_001209 [Kwoniella dendrophila CBS 6074]|uniref:Uncharacterized protein n=1 Tax=Kwoniella dendrophila CBS 6074 TaxID=1295534 RepID=A0AAX4JLP6_9TREE
MPVFGLLVEWSEEKDESKDTSSQGSENIINSKGEAKSMNTGHTAESKPEDHEDLIHRLNHPQNNNDRHINNPEIKIDGIFTWLDKLDSSSNQDEIPDVIVDDPVPDKVQTNSSAYNKRYYTSFMNEENTSGVFTHSDIKKMLESAENSQITIRKAIEDKTHVDVINFICNSSDMSQSDKTAFLAQRPLKAADQAMRRQLIPGHH